MWVTRARIALLDQLDQIDGGNRGTAAGDVEQFLVEQVVDFVIPRDDRASDAGKKQKAGGEKAGPAMQSPEDRSHGCAHAVAGLAGMIFGCVRSNAGSFGVQRVLLELLQIAAVPRSAPLQ